MLLISNVIFPKTLKITRKVYSRQDKYYTLRVKQEDLLLSAAFMRMHRAKNMPGLGYILHTKVHLTS